ncbi:hypothetical protein [Cytobacillus oceanisediminis]|uniref:Pectate lyase superfamily protein domain-containing protein n=1 Tax=Cytobacillus oceanisediminis 2691 TaxID=1196031 RepID=A0A160MAJ9_9BACI|nr:hypothetical protein [Cytobacillus oceanisediminis]AND39554.1 hypothetical protein A361_10555 [Cytobacillus oceanisediminis 2691]
MPWNPKKPDLKNDPTYLEPRVNNLTTQLAQNAKKSRVSITDYESLVIDKGLSTEDWQPAFDQAIMDVSVNGGVVIVPKGTYQTSEINLHSDYVYLEGEGKGTVLKACGDNQYIIRRTASYGGARNLQLYGNGKVNVFGLGVVPPYDYAADKIAQQNYNEFDSLFILGCTEGIVLQAGTKVNGMDSGCWYNVFRGIQVRSTKRGLWLKDPVNDSGSPCNRNQFYSLRIGKDTNTGVQIDAGDTNVFYSLSLEGIQLGTSPSVKPTGIVVKEKSSVGYHNTDNRFFGLTFEACTLDVKNDAVRMQIVGSNIRTFEGVTLPLTNMNSDPSAFPFILPGVVYPEGAGLGGYKSGAWNYDKPIVMRKNVEIYDVDYQWQKQALDTTKVSNVSTFGQTESWFTRIGKFVEWSCRFSFKAVDGATMLQIELPVTPHASAYTNNGSTLPMVFNVYTTYGNNERIAVAGDLTGSYPIKIKIPPSSGKTWHTGGNYNQIWFTIRYMGA